MLWDAQRCPSQCRSRPSPRKSYSTAERPPYKWKGFSLSPFDRSEYLYYTKERDEIFYTKEHRAEHRWLVRYHQAQIKDVERIHLKELRLLSRRRRIVLKRCKLKEKGSRVREFEQSFDVLRFQQLWEKSLVYCRLRIELRNLRVNCKRKHQGKHILTVREKEAWNARFLSFVRLEQWVTLLQVKYACQRAGEPFPEYLTAPFGQSFASYFGKFGAEFGWYQGGCLDCSADGATTPPVFDLIAYSSWSPLESEDTIPEKDTVCSKARTVSLPNTLDTIPTK